jgi:hypothetical protein
METPAVKVAIESVLTGDDRSLKDLKRQAEIEAPARWLPWLVGVLLALAAAAAAFVLWRRRRRPLPQIAQFQKDPIGSAEAELRELLGRGWLEEGMVRAFYIAFSEIVRRLIAAGIAIPTAERTTEEILGDARKSPDPPVSSRELAAMEKLLLQSDLVKFAKSLPSPEESRQAIEAAFDLAEAFRKRCAGAGQATGRPGEA